METEESDYCREEEEEEAVAERLKQEPVNCMDCPPENSRSGWEVAVGGGLTIIQEYFQPKIGRKIGILSLGPKNKILI